MKTLMTQCGLIAVMFVLTQPAKAEGLNGLNFAVTAPADWSGAATALFVVEDFDGNEQVIEYGIVDDPDEIDIVYFATTGGMDDGSTRLSIYRYDEQSSVFMRLWREDGDSSLEWNVIGYDNGRVVFLEQPADYNAGDCAQSVLTGFDGAGGASLWSLPDDNLRVDENGGLYWAEVPTAYAPPQELIDQARQMEASCQSGSGS